jgi:hypothetical protein
MANADGTKSGGRQKGTPNKPNKLKKYLIDLVDENTDRLSEELSTLKGKAYIDAMFALMEYVQPKLSRTEVKAEVKQETRRIGYGKKESE